MYLIPMFMAFLVACVVINVCLTKRQMFIARAFFLGFGIIIGTCSLFLIYTDLQLARTPIESLSTAITIMLGASSLLFFTVALVITVATVILSVIAIKKIAEYFKNKKHTEKSAPSKEEKPIAAPTFACLRKIFVLHCRWNN